MKTQRKTSTKTNSYPWPRNYLIIRYMRCNTKSLDPLRSMICFIRVLIESFIIKVGSQTPSNQDISCVYWAIDEETVAASNRKFLTQPNFLLHRSAHGPYRSHQQSGVSDEHPAHQPSPITHSTPLMWTLSRLKHHILRIISSHTVKMKKKNYFSLPFSLFSFL